MSYTFKTSIGDEVKVVVDFDYQPSEPADKPGEGCYPGCAEAAEVNSVWVGGYSHWCILEVLNDRVLSHLEEKCLEHLNSMSDANEPD